MKMVSFIGLEIIILIISYIAVKKYNGGKFKLEYIGMNRNKNTIKYVLMGLAAGFVMFAAYKFILFITHIEIYKGTGFEFYTINEVLISIAEAFAISISVSVCEEIFCRGVILNYLSKSSGETIALIISSIIFTLLHVFQYQNFIQLAEILILGFALGYCYILTKSLYLPIALNFAWSLYNLLTAVNGLGLFIFTINKKLGSDYCSHIIMVAQSVIEITVAVILICVDISRKNNLETGDDIKAE